MAEKSVETGVRSAGAVDRGLERALVAAKTALDNRGRDVLVLDMRELTTVFDYFVVATGASRRQLHAMAEEIAHALENEMGDHRLGREGYQESRWILLDYGDVVVHLFDAEARAYYRLEELWSRANRVSFEARAAQPQDQNAEFTGRT